VPDAPRVLIAGAGPTGLAAALRLAQRGVAVVVLEKRMQLGRVLRASAWLPPTLEAFEQLGILDGLLHTGLQARRIACLRSGTTAPLARFDLGLLADETRFPFRLHIDQGSVTAALAAGLAAFPNVRLAFDAELVRVRRPRLGKPSDDSARVTGRQHVCWYVTDYDAARPDNRVRANSYSRTYDHSGRQPYVVADHNRRRRLPARPSGIVIVDRMKCRNQLTPERRAAWPRPRRPNRWSSSPRPACDRRRRTSRRQRRDLLRPWPASTPTTAAAQFL